MTGPRRDLRLPWLGCMAWSGALLGGLLPAGHRGWTIAALGATLLGGGLLLARTPARRGVVAASLLVLVALATVAAVRAAQVSANPLASLAAEHAYAEVTGSLSDDPRGTSGASGKELVRLTVTRVSAHGTTYTLRAPLVLLGSATWAKVPAGAVVCASGRLVPADDASGLLSTTAQPDVVRRPAWWWRATGRVRGAIRRAVAQQPPDEAALVPALVDGDVSTLPTDLTTDFQTTGLTHLTAVSGTNLTLLVGFLLLLARWAGMRGRGLYVAAGLGILGFVLLARAEPSVLRAAAMGTVSLLALGHNGRQRALRAVGGAVIGLLLLDPGLAVSAGFALSVLATAGILLLAPAWRDTLRRWMPLWLAEAIAVPAAAQLACTPIIDAISGQVSVVAVLANLLAEPVVGPATVLGLAGGVVGLVCAPLGRIVAAPAAWSVGWLVAVARRCAALPGAGISWGTGATALVLLTVVVVLLAAATTVWQGGSHHGSSASPADPRPGERPRPGHAGDRQGGVPRRADRPAGEGGGALL